MSPPHFIDLGALLKENAMLNSMEPLQVCVSGSWQTDRYEENLMTSTSPEAKGSTQARWPGPDDQDVYLEDFSLHLII